MVESMSLLRELVISPAKMHDKRRLIPYHVLAVRLFRTRLRLNRID